ncbi:MAG: tRNA (N(6)-L-threonylcarbamoyladenosine(37)-C(2))-methylthiotransferase MtaB [Clostridia bacterium]|nr:tRNA (N(6)-L-threonylcarbamoyladenosine(37)-C(2))-methylthiotransferase MtaB [Clostridia bacterium]
MTVYLHSLGCKVNQYDTEALAEQFRAAGFDVSDAPEGCDVCVINSCTVTAVADQKSRQAIRHFRRMNPDACIVLSGCMVQAYPEKAAALEAADIVAGVRDQEKIIAEVRDFFAQKQSGETPAPLVDVREHDRDESFQNMPIESFRGRTRAFIKIQDGCDRRCSYCIIPTARGRSRSRTPEDLEAELRTIRDAGYREVVLVGINFCCYGPDLGLSFTDPVELACRMGFDRVRIGSLEFDNIDRASIEALAKHPNFCPQFHVSLQSGSDTTLRRMHRNYDTAAYEALCRTLRETFPDGTVTTDIMTGFPGETEEDFEASLAFAKKIGFEKIHVFPFSPRAGTPAAKMEPQVPKAVRKERCRRMIALGDELREAFLQKQVGRTVEVLCETFEDGFVTGYTKNYTPVRFPAGSALHNELVSVLLTGVDREHDACVGVLTT